MSKVMWKNTYSDSSQIESRVDWRVMKCPICHAAFKHDASMRDYGLHVLACVTAREDMLNKESENSLSKCPICFMAYANMNVSDIEFHEEECKRVNTTIHGSLPRRTRRAVYECKRIGSFLPAGVRCTFCGLDNRKLVRCGGSCKRWFHAHCIETISYQTSKLLEDFVIGGHDFKKRVDEVSIPSRSLGESWICGECIRGVHLCERCGYLGSDAESLVILPNVFRTIYYHKSCFDSYRSECDSRRLLQVGQDDFASDSTVLTRDKGRKPIQWIAMQTALRAGDVVLVLKHKHEMFHDRGGNQGTICVDWATVRKNEGTATCIGNSCVEVTMLADGLRVNVGIRCLLPIGNVRAYSSAHDFVKECLRWYAFCVMIRVGAQNIDHDEIVRITSHAFDYVSTKVGMPESACVDAVERANISYQSIMRNRFPQVFEETETPVYARIATYQHGARSGKLYFGSFLTME